MLCKDLLPLNNVFYFTIILISNIVFTTACCKLIVIPQKIQQNKLKRSCSVAKPHREITRALCLIIVQLHKHLGMIFDSKLSFDEHLKSVLKKITKTVRLLRKFQGIFPRTSLITIYKLFARHHLDYGDIIYDQIMSLSIKELHLYSIMQQLQ